MREFSTIAIKKSDGTLGIMHVVERAPLSAFSVEAAQNSGYAQVGDQWVRQIGLEAEVTKTHPDAVAWRQIDVNELPKTRQNRDALEDDGVNIKVNPARVIPPKEKTPDLSELTERVADLERQLLGE